jgi:hypothetical protein
MDQRKLAIKTFVKGSTLLEVVIAMVAIVFVFGISMMIFSNITISSPSFQKLKAQSVLEEQLYLAEHDFNYKNGSSKIEGFRVDEEILVFGSNNHQLEEIHLTAFKDNQIKIAELRKVINIGDESY